MFKFVFDKYKDKPLRCLQFGWDDGKIMELVKARENTTLNILNGAVEINEKDVRAYIVDTRLAKITGKFDLAFIDTKEPWAIVNIYRAMEVLEDGGGLFVYNCDVNFRSLAFDLTREGTMRNDAYQASRGRNFYLFLSKEGKLWST